MVKRVLLALAILQAAFLIAAVALYRPFYYEFGELAGLALMTPVLGLGLGAVLGWALGEGSWKRGLAILLACVIAALPAYRISKVVGDEVYRLRTERRNRELLREPERKLRELAVKEGWVLGPYDLNEAEAYAMLERGGQQRLAYVEIREAAVLASEVGLADLEEAFAHQFGASVALRPASLFNRRFLAVVAGKEVVVDIWPRPDERQWHLVCNTAECPAQVDLRIPFR